MSLTNAANLRPAARAKASIPDVRVSRPVRFQRGAVTRNAAHTLATNP